LKVKDLAKEIGQPESDFLKFLNDIGIDAKNATTNLDDDEVKAIKDLIEEKKKESAATQEKETPETALKEIILTEKTIILSELAKKLGVGLAEIMKNVLFLGQMLNLNSEVDQETATELAKRCGVSLKYDLKVNKEQASVIKNQLDKIEEEEIETSIDDLKERPPVVTIMGHVDHGKTAILDAIRKTNVVASEAGGITQHIGAYQVEVKGKKVTFLDTPGHAAFTTLRARGAQVTDIAILVVAADEGVMPQTVEAIHHAQAANVQIIVAINKIDKPEANIEQCKQQLTQYNLVAEEWGGKTIMVPVSAKSKKGLDELLDMILLSGEMLDLKANPKARAKGVVIEARLSKKKGPVATILIKSGTLKIGDNFVVGSIFGKVRALYNDLGKTIKSAPPGMPVELLGIANVPVPGEILEVHADEKICRILAQQRQEKEVASKRTRVVSMESMAKQIEEGNVQNLNLILKADVQGSLEAITGSIRQIETNNVNINLLHAGTGTINENDIMLAKASQALVIGFGVNINSEAQKIAEEEGIEVKLYKIIYQILDDLKKVVDGLFKVELEEIEIGRLEVRSTFKFSKLGVIAGCYVTSGKIIRNAIVKVMRDDKEIHKGKVDSLKRFKEDAKEVLAGFECGVVINDYKDFLEKDVLVVCEIREKAR
jgi:translation initiation factor IF-2